MALLESLTLAPLPSVSCSWSPPQTLIPGVPLTPQLLPSPPPFFSLPHPPPRPSALVLCSCPPLSDPIPGALPETLTPSPHPYPPDSCSQGPAPASRTPRPHLKPQLPFPSAQAVSSPPSLRPFLSLQGSGRDDPQHGRCGEKSPALSPQPAASGGPRASGNRCSPLSPHLHTGRPARRLRHRSPLGGGAAAA